MAKIIFQTESFEDFYDVKEELGRGNFAIVKRCINLDSGHEYAAKSITKKRSKASKRGMSREAVENEANVLMTLDHEAIMKLYDVFETRTNITLVMELLTGGELFEEIAKKEFILEKDACFYMKQVLSAVDHMHSQNIVHLDLKPENIVLKYPGSKEIKLIDFGLAKVLNPGEIVREMMGTPEFSAPEVINYDPIGPFTDMWAIGVVTYVLLSGASPFLGDNDQETYHNITSCEYEFDEEYFEKITGNAKDFIRKLLLKNAKERNTVKDCLDHPWIAFQEDENSIIDTQKMRAFVARRRWKQSLKLVATISRLKVLCRSSSPSPSSDASGDEGDSANESTEIRDNVKDRQSRVLNLPIFESRPPQKAIACSTVNKNISEDSSEERPVEQEASLEHDKEIHKDETGESKDSSHVDTPDRDTFNASPAAATVSTQVVVSDSSLASGINSTIEVDEQEEMDREQRTGHESAKVESSDACTAVSTGIEQLTSDDIPAQPIIPVAFNAPYDENVLEEQNSLAITDIENDASEVKIYSNQGEETGKKQGDLTIASPRQEIVSYISAADVSSRETGPFPGISCEESSGDNLEDQEGSGILEDANQNTRKEPGAISDVETKTDRIETVQQAFKTVNVVISLGQENVIAPIGLKDQLEDTAITKEVEIDDEMVLVEMVSSHSNAQ